MAEERWSVPNGRNDSTPRVRFGKPEPHTIVTRERTKYGRPIASMLRLASFAMGPSDTNNT
jgi:hypothetical protein